MVGVQMGRLVSLWQAHTLKLFLSLCKIVSTLCNLENGRPEVEKGLKLVLGSLPPTQACLKLTKMVLQCTCLRVNVRDECLKGFTLTIIAI